MSGIIDTAVTVNHEVNNPLQAIIASVQLLFIQRKDMDNELISKLKVIEEAAMKIGSVTKKLTQITDPTAKVYLDGTNMIPLPKDENEDEE
jgi:light-regulated signal transduction histidine kinase (bacteriophytochrome)